jgi:hypothetical protein
MSDKNCSHKFVQYKTGVFDKQINKPWGTKEQNVIDLFLNM